MIKCVIIIHNMVVEEHMFQIPAEERQFTKGILVCSCREFIWEEIVPMSGKTNVGDAVGPLVERCALEVFKDRVGERDQTKLLHIEHVRSPNGEI